MVDFLKVVLGEHAWDFSAAEQVVDVLEERFLDHVILREDEANLLVLEGSHLHDLEDVFSELCFTVILSDFDLLKPALADHASQGNHRFLA